MSFDKTVLDAPVATALRHPEKAHRPDQLSTLEATCAALAQLEGRGEPFLPLLKAFDGFVAQQMAYQFDAPHRTAMGDTGGDDEIFNP